MKRETGSARLCCYECGYEWDAEGEMRHYDEREEEYLRFHDSPVFYTAGGKACPECGGEWGYLSFERRTA